MEWWLLQMDVFIEKLLVTDAENLLNFELENRTFLKKWYPVVEMNTIIQRFLKKT